MAWECAECVRDSMTAVCHHCGKPLCDEHAVIVADDALAEYDASVSTRAMSLSDQAVHCADCQRQHHMRSQVVRSAHERVGT
jgi:hypothetical protein